MDRAPQMPPPEAPQGAARKDGGGFSGRRALIGALVGAAIGLIAHFLDASPWWWLAVPAGVILAATSFHFKVDVSWGRK
jgi:hypothetical protein